jgi:hypothetical protein
MDGFPNESYIHVDLKETKAIRDMLSEVIEEKEKTIKK